MAWIYHLHRIITCCIDAWVKAHPKFRAKIKKFLSPTCWKLSTTLISCPSWFQIQQPVDYISWHTFIIYVCKSPPNHANSNIPINITLQCCKILYSILINYSKKLHAFEKTLHNFSRRQKSYMIELWHIHVIKNDFILLEL